jgi:hypothetical protein
MCFISVKSVRYRGPTPGPRPKSSSRIFLLIIEYRCCGFWISLYPLIQYSNIHNRLLSKPDPSSPRRPTISYQLGSLTPFMSEDPVQSEDPVHECEIRLLSWSNPRPTGLPVPVLGSSLCSHNLSIFVRPLCIS